MKEVILETLRGESYRGTGWIANRTGIQKDELRTVLKGMREAGEVLWVRWGWHYRYSDPTREVLDTTP